MTATTIAIPAERGAARSEWLTLFRRLARRRTALFGLVVVALVFAAALGAPWLSPWDPIEQDITNRLKPPGSPDPSGRVHVLGTDHLGRDLLARVIFGARPALLVGVGGCTPSPRKESADSITMTRAMSSVATTSHGVNALGRM